MRAVLDTCKGNDMISRRDTAIIRLLIDTGGRLGEVGGLMVDDVDFRRQRLLRSRQGSSWSSAPLRTSDSTSARPLPAFPHQGSPSESAAVVAGREGERRTSRAI